MLPLQGITVVAAEQAVAAPFATRQLADLGARVIKIERPDTGDFARSYDTRANGLSSHFVWTNRSKESLTLDLKHPDAGNVVQRLLSIADIFVQNLAPGAAERLGLGTETLRRKYPKMIVCSISGYGSSGPLRDKKAYDLLIQGEAGLLSITGTEETPSKVGISIADIAGGMYAYSGILSALLLRKESGSGSSIEVSLFEALAEWMGYPSYYTGEGGRPPARTGASHATIAPYGPFAAADGNVVFLGVQNEREWRRFCTTVLERPDLLEDERFGTNSRRMENRIDLHRAIESVFDNISSKVLIERLDAAQIANSRMNDVHQLIRHEQLQARNRWTMVNSPAGPLPALIPPATIEEIDHVMKPIPGLGQHSASILRELGFDDSVIKAMRTSGVI